MAAWGKKVSSTLFATVLLAVAAPSPTATAAAAEVSDERFSGAATNPALFLEVASMFGAPGTSSLALVEAMAGVRIITEAVFLGGKHIQEASQSFLTNRIIITYRYSSDISPVVASEGFVRMHFSSYACIEPAAATESFGPPTSTRPFFLRHAPPGRELRFDREHVSRSAVFRNGCMAQLIMVAPPRAE